MDWRGENHVGEWWLVECVMFFYSVYLYPLNSYFNFLRLTLQILTYFIIIFLISDQLF
jgi:hypothetical protein